MKFTLYIGLIVWKWEHTWGASHAHGMEIKIGLKIV